MLGIFQIVKSLTQIVEREKVIRKRMADNRESVNLFMRKRKHKNRVVIKQCRGFDILKLPFRYMLYGSQI